MNALSKNIVLAETKEDETKEPSLEVSAKFSQSDWYKDIIFYSQNFSFSPTWDKDRARSIKLKNVKYCIFFLWGEGVVSILEGPKGAPTKFPH